MLSSMWQRTAAMSGLALLLLLIAACTTVHSERVVHTVELGGTAVSRCAYPCQNGGSCINSQCACPNGFVGIDCSRRGCSTNCNRRGYCDLSSSPPSCLCFPGWGGLECDLTTGSTTTTTTTTSAGSNSTSTSSNSTTTIPTTKPIDRTICNPPCDSVNGVCWQGQCACADGFTGPTCSDHICPDDCSFHGHCDKPTGDCECYAPYTGPTCASTTTSVVPRDADTPANVGTDPIPSTKSSVNRIFKSKKGLSDTIHLIEQGSQMEQHQYYDGGDL